MQFDQAFMKLKSKWEQEETFAMMRIEKDLHYLNISNKSRVSISSPTCVSTWYSTPNGDEAVIVVRKMCFDNIYRMLEVKSTDPKIQAVLQVHLRPLQLISEELNREYQKYLIIDRLIGSNTE